MAVSGAAAILALLAPTAALSAGAARQAWNARPLASHPTPRAAVLASEPSAPASSTPDTDVAAGAPAATVAAAASAKDAVISMVLDGLAVDNSRRADMAEQLLVLERHNPTPMPAASRLLNGVWELQFAGAPGPGLLDSPTREIALVLYSTGYSAGSLLQLLGKLPSPLAAALRLDAATITITAQEAGQPRSTTDVKLNLFGSPQHLKLRSNLQPVSGIRLREELVEAEALGQRTLLPGPLARTRQLFVTYLDEELLVVRDESGVSDVLMRKQKFSGEDLGERSFSDDDASPGAS